MREINGYLKKQQIKALTKDIVLRKDDLVKKSGS